MVAAAIAGVIAAEIMLSRQPQPSASTQPSSSTLTAATAGSQTPMAAPAVYKQDYKGVVTITVQSGNGFRRGQGTGSGIVIDKNGDILTANHVVDGASTLQVKFSDGTTVNGNVINSNPAQDLATVKVSVASSKLFPLPFGNSNNVLVGDTVYAIGSPFGDPESMTHGVVSGLNRTDPNSGLHGLIQTDARINPGNSGGPLLNTLGQVVGVNVAIESPVEGNVGVGFAVPINAAHPAEGGNL